MSGGPPEVPGRRSDDARERARRAREARRARPGGMGGARTAPAGGYGGGPARGASAGSGSPRERTRRRGATVLGGVLVVGALVVAWALFSYYQPLTGEGEGRVRVQIPNGASVSQMADILEQRGVISSPFFFRARARLTGRGTSLRPGTYTLAAGASNASVLDVLAAGPPPDVLSVTVPEGRSRREVAPVVSASGLDGSYLRATEGGDSFDPERYGAPAGSSYEGFLFPSTYELQRRASARDLVRRQTDAFAREAARVGLDSAPGGLSAYEALIVASMVEREAQVDAERPVIASVIYNRLEQGELLRIDATLRYATRNWTRPIRQSELASPDPYNTYTNAGLPPGPIGNPGRESLEAAANPADTDYLFYVVKPNTCGEHAFSDNEDQFFRDQQRYEQERQARGGRSPTDC